MKKKLLVLLFLLISGAIAQANGEQDSVQKTLDMSGQWDVVEEADATDCGEGNYTRTYTIEITQEDDTLTLETPYATFTGYLDLNNATWSGQYLYSGGTTRRYGEVDLNQDGTAFEGTETWNWENGNEMCVGEAQIKGKKVNTSSVKSASGQNMDSQFNSSNGCFINSMLRFGQGSR